MYLLTDIATVKLGRKKNHFICKNHIVFQSRFCSSCKLYVRIYLKLLHVHIDTFIRTGYKNHFSNRHSIVSHVSLIYQFFCSGKTEFAEVESRRLDVLLLNYI